MISGTEGFPRAGRLTGADYRGQASEVGPHLPRGDVRGGAGVVVTASSMGGR